MLEVVGGSWVASCQIQQKLIKGDYLIYFMKLKEVDWLNVALFVLFILLILWFIKMVVQ